MRLPWLFLCSTRARRRRGRVLYPCVTGRTGNLGYDRSGLVHDDTLVSIAVKYFSSASKAD